MRKTDPRLIINLNITDEDFEKHIELAVDKYIANIVDSCVDDKVTNIIKNYVDKKIDAILSERSYDSASLIEGRKLSSYIACVAKPKVEAVISDTIAQAVAETLANKFKA